MDEKFYHLYNYLLEHRYDVRLYDRKTVRVDTQTHRILYKYCVTHWTCRVTRIVDTQGSVVFEGDIDENMEAMNLLDVYS